MGNTAGRVILFIGGARSGKSALAERLVSEHQSVAYIATAEAIDEEMRERIKKHKESRPNSWITYEANGGLKEILDRACRDSDAVIVDCLTIYVARRMDTTVNDDEIIDEVIGVAKAAVKSGKTVVFVSNEVGMGLVPEYPIGRRYRDLLGKVNQDVARLADSVLFTIAGIPIDVKALGINSFNL